MTAAAEQSRVREGDALAGKFRIEGVLGSGGMGMVFAARNVELDQRAALKVLLPQQDDGDARIWVNGGNSTDLFTNPDAGTGSVMRAPN